MAHYKALLQEMHLGPDARWREYAERVRRDPQVRCVCCAVLHAVWHVLCVLWLPGCGGLLAGQPLLRCELTRASSCPVPHPFAPLQGRGDNPALERGEGEALFRAHVGALYDAALEAFLDLLDKELKVRGGRGRLCLSPTAGSAEIGVAVERGYATSLTDSMLAGPPQSQPLVPPREQEADLGLPRSLTRWRDAEPLLEEDERFGAFPEESRCATPAASALVLLPSCFACRRP